MRRLVLVLLLALSPPVASPAIYEGAFRDVASHQLWLHEQARVVEESTVDGARRRRVTVVADVVGVRRGPADLAGRVVVVDYTVDLDAMARAGREHAREMGDQVGPQFMFEPAPPALDAQGRFWANLAPQGGRLGNVNRFAGAVAGIGDTTSSGPVFVPVAGQYSFEEP